MKGKKENEESFFGGFEAIVDGIARVDRRSVPGQGNDPDEGFETVTEIGNNADEIPMTEPEEITEVKPVIKGGQNNGLQVKGKQKEEDLEEEEIIEDVIENEEPAAEPAATTNASELGEYEQDVVDFFADKFTSELGWQIDEASKPKSVSDVIEYLKGIIDENSKPQFANEDIEKLNAYVANGGDLKKFYNEVYGSIDLDSVDITNENIQKKVLSDNFSRLGYSQDRINKFLSRYEDAGTLQEEAEDALEALKESNKKKSETLLADQEKQRKESREQQQNFVNNVYTSIEKTDSIRGIPISVKERKELAEYIFKPEADGLTRYQKDYAKDYRNLIESAYFTMKGDSLIQKVTQRATSQAAKNLQDKLASKGKRVKNSATQGGQSGTLDTWSTVSRQLRRPNF